jgi:hypothetical protein
VSQAFLARWYVDGGYMDVSEVVVFLTPPYVPYYVKFAFG